MDFAVSNGGDNTIYVYLGNGDGTFKIPEILYTQGQSPDWIIAVRLRSNGHLDLAVTNGDSSTVEIFPGNGDGTFQASSQIPLPQIPTFIMAIDANNDGKQDLVVGLTIAWDYIQPQFGILLGDGAGGFSGTVYSQAIEGNPDGPTPTGWLAAGDLNNDGFVDFVTTVTGDSFAPYLSQSAQSFPFTTNISYNDSTLVAGVGDMDEDGCPDLIQFGDLGVVTIAKGNCDGTFDGDPYPAAQVGDLDPAIQVLDLDGDGHLDVVGSAVYYPLADNPPAGKEAGFFVSVLKGDGKGNLGFAKVYRGGASAYSFTIADFNGDHHPEVVTAAAEENRVSIFMNDGSDGYGDPQGITVGYPKGYGPVNAPTNLAPMQVADLNGDGKPDLYLVEYGEQLTDYPQLTALLNGGGGRFLPPVRTPIVGSQNIPVPILISGAFRNSATPDVIYMNFYPGDQFDVLYFAGHGDGSFAAPVVLGSVTDPQRLVAADFNHDGKLDFVVVSLMGTLQGTLWVFNTFLGHGDGTFTQLAPQQFSTQGTVYDPTFTVQQLFAPDLNHDGNFDLLAGLNANDGFVDQGDDLVEILGNGDGTFGSPTTLMSHFGAVAVADLNKDGYIDLVQDRDPNNFAFNLVQMYSAAATVYLGSSDGTFQQGTTYALPGYSRGSLNPVAVGDFNGDGIADLAVHFYSTPIEFPTTEATLYVLQGSGDGTFVPTGHNYLLPATSYPLVGADFNGDGKTDLLDLTGITSSFSTIPGALAPALDIVLNSSPVVGNSGEATVTLDLPAAAAEDVTLSASDAAVQLPTTLHFNTGEQAKSFDFTLASGLDLTHAFALYAKLGAQTAYVYSVKPNPNLMVGVTSELSYPPIYTEPPKEVSIEPGEAPVLYFGIESQGGYSGTYSSFQCSGLPRGVSCSFEPASVLVVPQLAGSVRMVINTSSSTPFGTYNLSVSATDGFAPTASTVKLGIGDFSFSVDPTTYVVGPTGLAQGTMTVSAIDLLNEPLSFTCSLPTGAQCSSSASYTSAHNGVFQIGYNQLAVGDYPFQITGTADIVSHSTTALLRVGDFSASLDKTTATISSGQSAAFNVTLTSLNHYASTISVTCSPQTANVVSCVASPSSVPLTDGDTTTTQLTISSLAAASNKRHASTSLPNSPWAVLALLPLAFLLMPRRRLQVLPILLVGLVLTTGMSCGGGGIGGGGGGGGGGGDNPQTVLVTVTAQAASSTSDSGNSKAIGTITVRVQ